MNIKFNSDEKLPLNKILKFHNLIIIVRSVFKEGGKYYPHIFQMNAFIRYKIDTI